MGFARGAWDLLEEHGICSGSMGFARGAWDLLGEHILCSGTKVFLLMIDIFKSSYILAIFSEFHNMHLVPRHYNM